MSTKFLIVLIILINLIVFRYFTTRPVYQNGDRIRITTTVYSDPIKYDTTQYLKISGLKVYLPKFPEINYGDRLIIDGSVDNGKLKNAKTQKIQTTNNIFLRLRHRLITFYQSVLPEPYAGLVGGIVLGAKGGLTNDFWQAVRKTGVAHVVVASGMNVTFVAAFLVSFLSVFLSRRKSIPIVILGIIMYLFVSGFEAPLVRAAIMGTIAFLAQETGRLVTSWKALVFSAIAMIIYKPEWVTDIGFQLSFVATGSILLFERKIHTKLLKIPRLLREGLSTSLAAQIGVTPILFVTFGQFNILSPITNMLVLWTIPYIMILGSVAGILQSKLVLYLSYPLLWWFSFVVTFFSSWQ